MVIYTRNDDYEIWANTVDKKFYVQMAGEEKSEVGYDDADDATLEAKRLLSEKQTEVVGCSNPNEYLEICRNCIRNNDSDNKVKYTPTETDGSNNPTCDGYINKDNKALF